MSPTSGIFDAKKKSKGRATFCLTTVNRDQARLTLATVPVHQLNNHQKLSVNLKSSSHHSKKIRANFDEDEFNFRDF